MMRTALLTLLATLIGAVSAAAEPLNREWVARDAKWLVHIDVERFAESAIGKFVIENEEGFDFGEDRELRELGINPFRDFAAITLYGLGDGKALGMMAFVRDADALFEQIAEQRLAVYETIDLDGHAVYAWHEGEKDETDSESTDPDDDPDSLTIELSVGGDDADTVLTWVKDQPGDQSLIVFAENPENLLMGIRVIEGDSPSLASIARSESSITLEPGEGSFISGSINDLSDLPDFGPSSPVTRKAKGFRFDMGESKEQLFLNLTVTSHSEQDAASMAAVVQGLIAMAMLATDPEAPDHPAIRRLAEAAAVSSDGDKVTMSLRAPVADAIEAMKESRGGGF